MSLLSRIFGTKSEATENASATLASTPEFDRLLAFGCALMCLLNEDRYIARSDYKPIVEEYADIKTFFLNLQASNLLGMYCATDDEEDIENGKTMVKHVLADNFVRPDEAEKIKSKILHAHLFVSYYLLLL